MTSQPLLRPWQNRRSGFSAESRTLQLLKKCGGLPTAATMKRSFSEVPAWFGFGRVSEFSRQGAKTQSKLFGVRREV